jgi:acetyl-CoA carboxylase biotin carboxyl carrier protein
MLEFPEIQQLVEQINNSTNITSFDLKHGSLELKIEKGLRNQEQNGQSGKTASTTVSNPNLIVPPAPPAESEYIKPAKVENLVESEDLIMVKSPMVGTFYASSNPDNPPYVKIEDKVQKDTVVCLVEAMKLFNEIEAETSGEIAKVHVESGQLVEYGQPLFSIRPL